MYPTTKNGGSGQSARSGIEKWAGLSRPGVEGPKVVPYELSLSAKMLRIVPECGDGVAVVIPERAVGTQEGITAAVYQEAVHEAAVERELLVAVAVGPGRTSAARCGQSERIGAVGIVGQQPGALQVVDRRSAGPQA